MKFILFDHTLKYSLHSSNESSCGISEEKKLNFTSAAVRLDRTSNSKPNKPLNH